MEEEEDWTVEEEEDPMFVFNKPDRVSGGRNFGKITGLEEVEGKTEVQGGKYNIGGLTSDEEVDSLLVWGGGSV
jgi:hypothetical protein